MGGKSSPAPPDYTGAANAQAAASKDITEQQTWANRPDQYTPFGSQTWDQRVEYDPVTGQSLNKWSQQTTLDPLSQASLESQQRLGLEKSQLASGMTDRMWREYGQEMDWSGHPGMAQTPDVTMGNQLDQYGVDTGGLRPGGQDVDPSQRYSQDAGDALYGRATSRLDPQWERREDDMKATLVAQGLRPGDAAYDRAIDEASMQRSDAYQQAGFGADIGAGQEAQRYHGMDLSTGQYDEGRRQQQLSEMMGAQGFNNQAEAAMWGADETQRNQQFQDQFQQAGYQNNLRQQSISEDMQRRGFSLNEINAVMSGQQVGMPQMPSFSYAQSSQTPQYMDAAKSQYSGALDQYSAEQAGMQGLMGGIGSMAKIGASAGMFSDRRLKRNIKRIGKLPSGVSVYSFDYIWGESAIGVMADEVPWAVVKHESGYDMVDYARIL